MSTEKTQTPESLPNDVDSLKRIIIQQAMRIALLEEYNLLEKIRRLRPAVKSLPISKKCLTRLSFPKL